MCRVVHFLPLVFLMKDFKCVFSLSLGSLGFPVCGISMSLNGGRLTERLPALVRLIVRPCSWAGSENCTSECSYFQAFQFTFLFLFLLLCDICIFLFFYLSCFCFRNIFAALFEPLESFFPPFASGCVFYLVLLSSYFGGALSPSPSPFVQHISRMELMRRVSMCHVGTKHVACSM